MVLPTYLARTLALAISTAAVHIGSSARTAVAQQDEPVRREITLEVRNDNFFDARIYAIRGGLRQRLGFVNGNGKGTFRFLWLDGDLWIEINFVAGGRYLSQVIDVQPGDELELTILPGLHMLPSGTVF